MPLIFRRRRRKKATEVAFAYLSAGVSRCRVPPGESLADHTLTRVHFHR